MDNGFDLFLVFIIGVMAGTAASVVIYYYYGCFSCH